MKWLRERSIWSETAIEPEDFKYRNLNRLWLPLFDVICVAIGFLAIFFGSTLLNESYDPHMVDAMGWVFVVASATALIGVAFPCLWLAEMVSKIFMMALLGTYSLTIWISFFQGNTETGFVAAILILPILMPLFRLGVLAEEYKQRKADEEEKELA